MKRSKAYRDSAHSWSTRASSTPRSRPLRLAQKTSSKKTDSTIDVVFKLGVDPRHADQMVRSTVILPHGTGKTSRVLVFANGEKAEAALATQAPTSSVATNSSRKWRTAARTSTPSSRRPTSWARSAASAACSVPRGLMPNPKTGTVTMDVAKAVSDIKGGKIEFRVDKHANLHTVLGKASFGDVRSCWRTSRPSLDEVLRSKPAASKGRYILKASISATTGPGIPMDATAKAEA